jgi:hypothetical protein
LVYGSGEVPFSDKENDEVRKGFAKYQALILGTEKWIKDMNGTSTENLVDEQKNKIKKRTEFNAMTKKQLQEWINDQANSESEYMSMAKEIFGKFTVMEKDAAEKAKRSAQALADYRVLIAKEGFEQELKAQKEALQVKLKNDLSNVDLTENERTKMRAETKKAIEKLDEDYQKKQLQDAVTTLDAELAGEREFNTETLNLRLARLEAQKKLDLANAKDDKAQQILIEKEYEAAVTKLHKDHGISQSESEANTAQSNLEARLAATKKASKEEHDVRAEQLRKTAESEIESASATILNEEERAAKIEAIRANLARDLNDLDIEYIKSADERSKAEVLAATQQYEQGKISKFEYEKQLQDIHAKALQDEINDTEAAGKDITELRQKQSEDNIAIAEQEAEQRKQIFQELYNLMGEIGSALFDAQKQGLDQELEDLNHYYTTDAEAAKKNKDLKLITEEEMARRQLEIKRKQAQAEKNQAYFNATLQLAEGIVRIWSQTGVNPALAGILTGILVANAAIQIATISSKPLPKYARGRRGGRGEFALVGEQGPEMTWIPEGTVIMPASDTRRALQGDIRMFSKWDMPRLDANMPTVPRLNQQAINQYNREHPAGEKIDYDRLGRAVAKHLKFPKQRDVSVHFDKAGLAITEGNTTTRYLNAKYNR